MATLGNKKIFGGTVGNVVFRNLDGRQVIQSRPVKMKQTTATKKSASEFGRCSNWAKKIRAGLHPFLIGMTDSYMYQRFTAQLYNSIKDSELPQGGRTPLTSNMQALEAVDGIVFPAGCRNAKLIVYIFATDFKDNTIPVTHHNILAIDQNTSVTAQTVLSTAPLPADHFVLVAAKLLYFKPNAIMETNYLNTKDFSPAMVILAGATGN